MLVVLQAASIDPLDLRIRDCDFRRLLAYETPFVLGNDMGGTGTAVGKRVQRFNIGDQVYARPRSERIGTFAERIAAHQDDLALKPTSVDMAEAASLPLVAPIALQSLVGIADVQPGQKVLIHAGAGGVGTIASQLAKHLGATVATTTSISNHRARHRPGADVVVDYRTEQFEQVLSEYDVVLDSLGGREPRAVPEGAQARRHARHHRRATDLRVATQLGLNTVVGLVMNIMSPSIRLDRHRRRPRWQSRHDRDAADARWQRAPRALPVHPS